MSKIRSKKELQKVIRNIKANDGVVLLKVFGKPIGFIKNFEISENIIMGTTQMYGKIYNVGGALLGTVVIVRVCGTGYNLSL